MLQSTRLLAILLIGFSAWTVTLRAEHPLQRASLQPQPLGYRIDINAADADELTLLPGVGPGLAQHILRYRAQAGPFTHARDLELVPMIGPRTRARIEPWVRIGPVIEGKKDR